MPRKEKNKTLTSEGLPYDAIVPAEVYQPGSANMRLTLQQMTFLDEYAKDLDAVRSAGAAGYKNPSRSAEDLLKVEAIQKEIGEIHEVWAINRKHTAEHTSAKMIKLLEKIEDDYDSSAMEDKAKFSNSLVKGTEILMRSTGHFSSERNNQDTQITINIDLGAGEETKNVTIEGDYSEK